MASFLNTNIGDLVSQWQENAAINEQTALFEEAYERARVNSIRSAGAEAFRSGMSLDDAKAGYRENLELQAAEKQYPRGDVSESGALDFVDDLGGVDDMGAVDDSVEDDFVPFDPAEDWEIAMEQAARDVYLDEAAQFEKNQLFSRNL